MDYTFGMIAGALDIAGTLSARSWFYSKARNRGRCADGFDLVTDNAIRVRRMWHAAIAKAKGL